MRRTSYIVAIATVATLAASTAGAQTAPGQPTPPPTGKGPASAAVTTPAKPAATPPTITAGITPPSDYVIGVDDSLDIVYWQDKDMSASVVVRPDGNISLPLLNEVKVAGLTPEQLRVAITEAATKFVEGPTVSVVVKAINSRKVYLTGAIAKPGPYPLMDETTVLQMLAIAGGPNEYAKTEKITIVRRENGKDQIHKFNYKAVSQGRSLDQNIALKPGDTVIVP